MSNTCFQQYLVFGGVGKSEWEKLLGGKGNVRAIRTTYYHNENILIVKVMPWPLHEATHGLLTAKLYFKMAAMGLGSSDIIPLGTGTFHGQNSSKQADHAFKPPHRSREDDWPTLVVEVGLTESLNRLRGDANWWLRNSGGAVKIVLIISIKRATRELSLEKWMMAPPGPNRRVTRSVGAQGVVPTKIQHIHIANGGTTTVGGSLVPRFEDIFLRSPNAPLEHDFQFTNQELSGLAMALWNSMQ